MGGVIRWFECTALFVSRVYARRERGSVPNVDEWSLTWPIVPG